MTQKEQLFRDIGIVSFVLVELAEFLDTHPEDGKAMEFFNHYNRMKQQLMKEFSVKYYPLTQDYADSMQNWRWGDAPLPWEGGCE